MKMHKKLTEGLKTIFIRLIFLLFASYFFAANAQSFVLTKTRAPKVDVTNYKQIAIGDITGPSGTQTEESLNLSDELSSKLFNSNAQEILDRNALEKILSSSSKFTLGDEKTIAALRKKLNSAVLLTGRLQTKNISQEETSSKNIVVVNGCYYTYQWKASCEMTVQVKMVDISTGKMLFNGPVSKKSSFESKAGCEHTQKIESSYMAAETLKDVAAEITKLLVPYKEEVNIPFLTGTLFKKPFKKIDAVIMNFRAGNFEDGLKILKAYADDNSLKDKFKEQAYFNYALGLFCANQFEQAKAEIKKALAISPGDYNYQFWNAKFDEENKSDQKIAKQ